MIDSLEGRIFSCEEVYGKEIDFCLTVNNVADILAYAVPTVQTYIIPKLDRVYADDHIKDYMRNNRIKLVISKESLIRFLGVFLQEEERNTVYCLREDSGTLQENFKKLKKLTINNRDMRARIQDAAKALNKKFDGKTDSEAEVLEENEMLSVIKNNLFSIRQLQNKHKFKHIMQIYRFLETQNYIKIKLGTLKGTSTDCNKNIRYLFIDGTKWNVKEKNCIYVSLTNRVTNRLKFLETFTDAEMEKLIMELLIKEIETH